MWLWLKKYTGIDLLTREGVFTQRQKDALANGYEITDEMIAAAHEKYKLGVGMDDEQKRNGNGRKRKHVDEED